MPAVARAAAVPVAVHLDHATSADLVREAVGLGFGPVMFDASALPHEANVAGTAEVARLLEVIGAGRRRGRSRG
ncbi:class II fructose-bisphosphate aldolase [Spirillospora sp. NPDC049024]